MIRSRNRWLVVPLAAAVMSSVGVLASSSETCIPGDELYANAGG